MDPVQAPANGSRFCVVVHDVTPLFAGEIDQIVGLLEPMVGRVLAGALVPRWGGTEPSSADRRLLADWSTRFGEWVLHGWTHRQQAGRGVISWCTDGANEFERLSPAESLERLRLAQLDAQDLLGRPLRGFVPPAWRLNAGVTQLRPAGIEYVMRFHSLEADGKKPVPLATRSWDWGWLPGTQFTGAALGACCRCWNSSAVPAVVLHPLDVHRGCLPAAQRLIDRFLWSGRVPILPDDLAASTAVDRQR